jgi:uncharacterized protein YidB (DUF937 family)
MSLFDSLKQQLTEVLKRESAGSAAPEAAAAAHPGLIDEVLKLIQAQGLGGLLDKFKGQGFEDLVNSWVSKGVNLPVSADQIRAALGPDQLDAMAQKLGLPAGQVSGLLAKILPGLVDRMTPNGLLEEPTGQWPAPTDQGQ